MSIPESLKLKKMPTRQRSQETIARILKAATHILEMEGPSSFNTNAIVEKAEVSIGSLPILSE